MGVVTVAGSQVERDAEVDRPSVVRERLEAFAGEMFVRAMNRPVQMRNGGLYLRGLIEDGARKSLEPLVSRLGEDADYQSMQQFLADSPWDPGLVVQAVAERVAPEIGVEAWVVDDTGFPKDGKDSPGVKRQYSGTFGKVANCQLGVSLHAVGNAGHGAVGVHVVSPGGVVCRTPTGGARRRSPTRLRFRTKYELAAELVERAWRWQVPRAPVLGDHDYGRRGGLRERLHQAGCEYVLAVEPTTQGVRARHHLSTHAPSVVARANGRAPIASPSRCGELIARLGQGSAQTVSFRDGPDGEPVTSTLHLHARAPRALGAATTGDPTSGTDPTLAPRQEWLIAEWPADDENPSGYWLSNLPADTPPEQLARLARLRWKIELDYKQLKGELGLDHYEGRSWLGWYHHTALVGRRPRLPHARAAQPFSPAAGLTLDEGRAAPAAAL